MILGGGDTGNDCAATAIRQGAVSVTQIEMMPKPPAERAENNPWPEWPLVLKTDYGQEEAIVCFGHDPRIYSSTITSLVREGNTLCAVETAKVSFRDRKMEVSGDREVLPCELLIIAAGFTGCEKELPDSAGIACTVRNTVMTGENSYMTNREGVFAAGDMHTGQSLVVNAVNEGIRCAKEADAWLMGYTNLL